MHGENWKNGSIIRMFEENLCIRENDGASGTVETLDGQFAASFYGLKLTIFIGLLL